MKAITVRQPWAWAIMHGGKDVENRTRNIAGSYRGPLVIHAGKALDPDEFGSAVDALDVIGVTRPAGRVKDLGFGVALGVVDLTARIHHADECWDDYPVDPYYSVYGFCSKWAMPDQWHLTLANPRPFPEPIPYKGALGLWNFPDELLPEEFR